MKLKPILFSFILLPLFIQCNRISRLKNHQQNISQPQSSETSTASANDISEDTTFSAGIKEKIESNKNPFGVLIDRTDNAAVSIDKKIQVTKALGLNYVRLRTDIQGWSGVIPNYDDFTSAGFKIILNINYGIPRGGFGQKQPVPFPTDLDAYSKTLSSILDKYKPELVVIENEEDNIGYHSGPADDYINELKAAISICHAKGIKVSNGGLTEREIMLLAFDDLMNSGKQQEAYDFAKKGIPQQYLSKLNNYQNMPMVQHALDFGKAVVAAYKTLDLDYVNFHWYEPSAARGRMNSNAVNADHIEPTVFAAVVNYLSKKTGKPVITNEFGVLNTSPTLISELMQKILDAKMDYAIFYSGDGAGGSVALQNSDGSLRQIGEAVHEFIKQNCQ